MIIPKEKRLRTAFVHSLKALTKSTLCQTLRKPARRGSKLADKGAYMDVSDRRLQVQLTMQAKITSNFSSFEVIFAFVGFVSGLRSFEIFIRRIFCVYLPRQ